MSSVQFMSRFAMIKRLNLEGIDNQVVISISDNGIELRYMDELLKEKVPQGKYHTIMFMDDEKDFGIVQAESLVEFINRNFEAGNKDFLVHCFAGISRSAAVAKYIDEIYGMNDLVLENYSIYNKHVYTTLKQAFFRKFYSDTVD